MNGASWRAEVSVVATVKDEAASIGRLLESLAVQTRPPDEVVIVDGGSSDGTIEAIEAWMLESALPIRLEVRPGANISQGRNAAVELARGELIACTDAGVRLSPEWLEALVEPLEEGRAEVASGFFRPDPESPFEIAMGATVLPAPEEIQPRGFLPSSRSLAFRKQAWREVGGYPQWLDYCEDLVFDLKLRRRGCRFEFVPQAIAHFRPRSSLPAFFRQYYQYARGDGKAHLWPARHALRYASYLALLPLCIALGLSRGPLWWLIAALGAAAYLWTPYKRLRPMLRGLAWSERLEAVLWVPLIRATGDIAKMVGYPVGVLWRFRYRGGRGWWEEGG
jgi:glycosyltransferase involved in cell wall biosynthesis